MKLLYALLLVAACSGPTKKPEGPIVNEGSAMPDACCCKHHPLTAEDGRAVYASMNPMECSSKQGECVPDVQCAASAPEPTPAPPSETP